MKHAYCTSWYSSGHDLTPKPFEDAEFHHLWFQHQKDQEIEANYWTSSLSQTDAEFHSYQGCSWINRDKANAWPCSIPHCKMSRSHHQWSCSHANSESEVAFTWVLLLQAGSCSGCLGSYGQESKSSLKSKVVYLGPVLCDDRWWISCWDHPTVLLFVQLFLDWP